MIVHSFEHEGMQEISVLVKKGYVIDDKYEAGDHKIRIDGDRLKMEFAEIFDAVAVLLSDCIR